jgi:hypothetical protein
MLSPSDPSSPESKLDLIGKEENVVDAKKKCVIDAVCF